jgi:glycosyltransferase involved in cell wall biosynthesis
MSGHNSPLVSVIIPVFNGEETICRAIDSVFAQSYQEWEVIVVDDGSTDSTKELLRKYGSKIRLVEQANGGVASARNHGVGLARGEYIAFLDHDDFWISEKLAIQIEILNSHPSIGLTFGNLEVVNKRGEKLGFTMLPSYMRYAPSWEDILLTGSIVQVSTVLARRGLILKIGGFDADLFTSHGYEDRDFSLRLRELADFNYLDLCLAYYCYDQSHGLRRITSLFLYARKYWNHPRLQRDTDDHFRIEFMRRCSEEMRWLLRILVRVQGDRVSREMLEQIISYHETFKDIFGDAYKRVSHFDPIDLSRYEPNSAVSLLLYLYLCRSDLQTAYPEVGSGDLSRLIDWGLSVARGSQNDDDHPILLGYVGDFERLRKNPPNGRA